MPLIPVSYTHLDVYKRQLVGDMSEYYYSLLDKKGVNYRDRLGRPVPSSLEDSI